MTRFDGMQGRLIATTRRVAELKITLTYGPGDKYLFKG